jgi:Xaa-Pro aminopeptidase
MLTGGFMPERSAGHPSSRLYLLRENLKRKHLDGLLVSEIDNVRYLTGFSGTSGFALITGKEAFFVTDFRYREQSTREVKDWNIVIEKGKRVRTIYDLSKKNSISRLGFESSLSYEFYEKLSKTDLRLQAVKGLVEKFREMKDASEISSIREATTRAEAAFLDVKPYVKCGTRELSVALRLEERLKKRGCRRIPFDIIVASGPNSAMPHARPAERKLSEGDLVVIDWGGEADGYFSDMTRTFLLKGGAESGKKRKIYQTVLTANSKAIACVCPGLESRKIDEAARSFIQKAGYGEFFGHGTGHGVGLQVHESPRITWSMSEVIREGMVFTIEPGIYVPGLGGVRIEDMVVVGKRKANMLTSLPREMEIL